jgi:hypothetical protein
VTQTQDPRRHPLQDDEVELARVLRALPAGEPSSKVDAAILAAASDAAATTPDVLRPRRRAPAAWAIPSWAIGTAAAAVLAVGIGTQLMPPLATQDRAESAAAAPAAAKVEREDRLDVDLLERKREIPPTYPPPEPPKPVPPPPPPPMAQPAPAAPSLPVAEMAAPEPQAFPAPAPATAPVGEAGAFAPPPADSERDAVEVTGSRLRRDDTASRLRQSPAEQNVADAERRAQARQLEQLRAAREEAARDEASMADSVDGFAASESAPAPVVSGGADADAGTSALAKGDAPVAADAELAPSEWIERIRARWRAGDQDGARESLKLLRERHPDLAIPADLEPLQR